MFMAKLVVQRNGDEETIVAIWSRSNDSYTNQEYTFKISCVVEKMSIPLINEFKDLFNVRIR